MRKHSIILFFIWCMVLVSYSVAEDRWSYGVKFGLVQNGFEAVPNSTESPFALYDIEGQTGFMVGAFYEYQLAPVKVPGLAFTFGIGYKFNYLKGDYATADDPPVIGDFKNYFHILDVPIGFKYAIQQMNGRPFVAMGVQTDYILGESQTLSTVGEHAMDVDTVPDYNSRINAGIYFGGGFDIPGKKYSYIIEFRYVRWMRDNFLASTSYFVRKDGEFQFTLGIKVN
mgnify:CR=1 FL=1